MRLSLLIILHLYRMQALFTAKNVVAQIETPKAVEEAVETGMDHMKAHLQIVEVHLCR